MSVKSSRLSNTNYGQICLYKMGRSWIRILKFLSLIRIQNTGLNKNILTRFLKSNVIFISLFYVPPEPPKSLHPEPIKRKGRLRHTAENPTICLGTGTYCEGCYSAQLTLRRAQAWQEGDRRGRTSSNTVDSLEWIRSLTRTQFRRMQKDLVDKQMFSSSTGREIWLLSFKCVVDYFEGS